MCRNIFKCLIALGSLLIVNLSALQAQGTLIGRCEGCEAVFEYGDRDLSSSLRLPAYNSANEQIRVSGTVYEPDGVTPATGVILYVYHTNDSGVYPVRGSEEGWARRHGYIRGWLQTDSEGKYTFFTSKPGSYGSEPAHIHLTVLEPDGKYYWLPSYLFEGDLNINASTRNNPKPRGGSSGILQLKEKDGLLSGRRDIVLGKNVRGYH